MRAFTVSFHSPTATCFRPAKHLISTISACYCMLLTRFGAISLAVFNSLYDCERVRRVCLDIDFVFLDLVFCFLSGHNLCPIGGFIPLWRLGSSELVPQIAPFLSPFLSRYLSGSPPVFFPVPFWGSLLCCTSRAILQHLLGYRSPSFDSLLSYLFPVSVIPHIS